jgi:formylglycine-generating enzyme required for sulfatase activity
MAGSIFINYRREDSIGTAGRLHDRLAQAFGHDRLFMDVDHIPAGVDFVSYLQEQVGACEIFLALIGPHWLTAKDAQGRTRLDNPHDFVVVEIAAALARNIRVIPVLIDGAQMPSAEELPQALKALSRRNAVEVRNSQFGRDADGLVQKIRGATKAPAWPRTWAFAAAGLVMLLGAGAALYEFGVPGWMSSGSVHSNVAADTSKPGEVPQAAGPGPTAEPRGNPEARPDPARSVIPGSGQSFRDPLADGSPCPMCPEMVAVPKGSFTMGSPSGEQGRRADEGPARFVSIAQPFAIGKYLVTRAEFAAFAGDAGYNPAGGCDVWNGSDWVTQSKRSWQSPGFDQDDRHPVVCVSWSDAKTLAAWLSAKTGRSYRLPSEAEWEYAARAGTTTPYYFGSDDREFCRYGNGADATLKKNYPNYSTVLACDDGYLFTAPVGSFLPNAFGLYDMHGNAWEWIEDCYHDGFAGAPADGSAWRGNCTRRVVRGGSWASFPRTLRSASRASNPQDARRDQWGIRLARSIAP